MKEDKQKFMVLEDNMNQILIMMNGEAEVKSILNMVQEIQMRNGTKMKTNIAMFIEKKIFILKKTYIIKEAEMVNPRRKWINLK